MPCAGQRVYFILFLKLKRTLIMKRRFASQSVAAGSFVRVDFLLVRSLQGELALQPKTVL